MFDISKALDALDKMNATQMGQMEVNLALAITRYCLEYNKTPHEVIKLFTEVIEEAKKTKKAK